MKYKRFFAFGCSFTKWKWKTWPDFLAESLNLECNNFAVPGAGNEYIFHSIVEANETYKFNQNDLIIVCWTNFAREDRYIKDKWVHSSNIYNYTVFDRKWVNQWFDLKGAFKKTCSYIASITNLLENTKSNFLYTSIMPMDFINDKDPIYQNLCIKKELLIYDKYFKLMLPSMVEYLYDSLPYCRNPNPQAPNDNHPSEVQHLQFVNKIILPNLETYSQENI